MGTKEHAAERTCERERKNERKTGSRHSQYAVNKHKYVYKHNNHYFGTYWLNSCKLRPVATNFFFLLLFVLV